MKNLFEKWIRKSPLSFNDNGVSLRVSTKNTKVVVGWEAITKVVFVGYFEEYSGYFLTDEFTSKELYNDIFVDCNQNIVKIRTGGRSRVKKNTSSPFQRKFGTTSIHNVVFVEYCSENESKPNLFAVHFNSQTKLKMIKELESFLAKETLLDEHRVEGFSYIKNI